MYNSSINRPNIPLYAPSAPELPHPLHNNPFSSPIDTLPLHLLDLDTPVEAPYYPVINEHGQLIYQSHAVPTWAANWPLPVAPSVQAATLYNQQQGFDSPCESVTQFQRSDKFSEAQKQGIEAFYIKHDISIGIAHQLEDLVNYRFEFMLDDSSSMTPHEFETLKKAICKRVELLRHIPNKGIAVRSFSESDYPRVFHIQDESVSDQVFFNIRDDLTHRQQTKHTGSLQQVYQTAVGDAVRSGIKTILYVFSARDLTQGKSANSAHVKALAKELTKTVVNRPFNTVPTAFFIGSHNKTTKDILNALDTAAKKVGVISPYEEELKQITQQQSKRFPFGKGYYIQASLLCPVSPFWDEIDEGRLFSRKELGNHLGITLTFEQHDKYYNEALDLQAAQFQRKSTEEETSQSNRAYQLYAKPTSNFETSTTSPYVQQVPALLEQIEIYRQHPAWTDAVEEGINRMCSENNIPIGIGLHMFQAVEKHHEFNIDNSGSMSYRADQTDESPRSLRDSNGIYHPSRMEELKELLYLAAGLLSYLPTKGVTISTFYGNNRSANHPHWTLETTGNNREEFLRDFNNIIKTIQPNGGTPLNEAAQNIYDRANHRTEKTNVIFFTDGQPNDQVATRSNNHRAPAGSIVSSQSIREFIKRLVNREAEHMPVTIAQTTNNPQAVAWTNLTDQVCYKTNAIDDFKSEEKEVKAHHGRSFHYDKKIYAMALLLGSDNPLFDALDEHGIWSQEDREILYGRPETNQTYDRYFDEAYALQCVPYTESIKSPSVQKLQNWNQHASVLKTHQGLGKLARATGKIEASNTKDLPPIDDEEPSQTSVQASSSLATPLISKQQGFSGQGIAPQPSAGKRSSGSFLSSISLNKWRPFSKK